jgi:hypothetical protein
MGCGREGQRRHPGNYFPVGVVIPRAFSSWANRVDRKVAQLN